MAHVHTVLDGRGIPHAITPAAGIPLSWMPTASGFISPENGWSFLRPPTFAPDTVVVRDEPVFRPAGIEHVLLNAADPEASARFYEKIFGPVAAQQQPNLVPRGPLTPGFAQDT
jgi:hypothetical protein